MSKPILYIDMDGVVADFDKAANEKIPGFSSFNKDERDSKLDLHLENDKEFFHDLEPIHGAVESVTILSNFYEIYFLSTPMWSVPESFTGKRLWVEEHFGKFATKRLILTHRKDLNIGDYLIDDRIHNGAGKFRGEHIHFGQGRWENGWASVFSYLRIKAPDTDW